MKIKIITCHDVYNVGASLQAYALSKYLRQQGHDVKNIDYKPVYLQHYRLSGVSNPLYDKPILREVYQILKFPGRVKERFGKRKKAFDDFSNNYLSVTDKRYTTIEELQLEIPEADLYIAGSDQIWNPLFCNGKDPAFFLQFAPENSRKISYAASFAVDSLSEEDKKRMKSWLCCFDAISVREKSGVTLLHEMGLEGVQVCDPVFLIQRSAWEMFAIDSAYTPYLMVYDFDNNSIVQQTAKKIAEKRKLKIVSVFPWKEADYVCENIGPREFLGLVCNADVIISNSFHATAFSLIFHKEFYVVNRKEKINTRMRDLLDDFGLEDHLVSSMAEVEKARDAEWNQIDERIMYMSESSKSFLKKEMDMVQI